MKKRYVLDTNIYLTDAQAIYQFDNDDIIVPYKVLDEIDKHKKRRDGVGKQARDAIRILDELRQKGDLHKGVRIDKGRGLLRVVPFNKNIADTIFPNIDWQDSDNQILGTAIAEKEQDTNKKRKYILVSRDINMRVKSQALGIPSENYEKQRVVSKISEVYSGYEEELVDDEVIEAFYAGENIYIETEHNPNQFIMLKSSSDPKRACLCRYISKSMPVQRIDDTKKYFHSVDFRPRNKEQRFLCNLMFDDKVKLVTATGLSGSGKTLTALACALEQVLSGKYKRLLVSRPIQPMGKDLGYLPGSIEEKFSPYLAPIEDNLENLIQEQEKVSQLYDDGIIQIEVMTYIRGRSIADSIILVDEVQSTNRFEIKTLLTRAGNNSKIVLTGDIEQIDNMYVDETSNGLVYAIESFKDQQIAGHISLQKGERSELATIAAEIL